MDADSDSSIYIVAKPKKKLGAQTEEWLSTQLHDGAQPGNLIDVLDFGPSVLGLGREQRRHVGE